MKQRAKIKWVPRWQKWQVTYSDGLATTHPQLSVAHGLATRWEKWNAVANEVSC